MSRLISSSIFCIFLLITLPVISHAQSRPSYAQEGVETSTETPNNNILIYGGDYSYDSEAGEKIKISVEDVKNRLLLNKDLHFVKDQKEENRRVEAKWIIDALNETAVKLEKLPSQLEFPNHLKDKIRYERSQKILIFKRVMSKEEKEQLLGLSTDILYKEGIEKLFKSSGRYKRRRIRNAVITGDLDFRIDDLLYPLEESALKQEVVSKLKERGVENVFLIFSRINIKDSRLEGKVLAGEDEGRKAIVVFQGLIGFTRCAFQEVVDFRRAAFGRAGFGEGIFKGNAEFSEALFLRDAYFQGTIFKGSANFSKATFGSRADFQDAAFHNQADFRGTHFKGILALAIFDKVTFKGDTDFSKAVFDANRYFRSAAFGKSTLFNGTVFKWGGGTYFNGAVFNGDAHFSCIFEQLVEFKKAIFKAKANFNVTFKRTADFREASFEKGASFSGATFEAALFNSTDFKGETIFDGAIFVKGSVVFYKAVFEKLVSFSGATFHDTVRFSSTTFRGDTNFSETAFKSEADFALAIFEKSVSFGGAKFESEQYRTNFNKAAFHGDVDFSKAIFKGEVTDFSEATFQSKTIFAGTIFQGRANFRGIPFKGDMHFAGAIFQAWADFQMVNFHSMADFDSAEFKDKADFLKVRFQEKARFKGATFQGEADFRWAKFEGEVDFSETTFQGRVEFYDASFAKDVNLQGSNYSTLPIHPPAQEGQELATEKVYNNIRIIESYKPYKRINISSEDIRTRLLLGEKVHFVEDQDETRKTINSEWIYGALNEAAVKLEKLPSHLEFPDHLKDKIRYEPTRRLLIFKLVMSEEEKEQLLGLSSDILYKEAIETLFWKSHEKTIDIKNAIITGSLYLTAGKEVLVEDSGLEQKEIDRLKKLHIVNVYLIPTSISIVASKVNGTLSAAQLLRGVPRRRPGIVLFQSDVSFSGTSSSEVTFYRAIFQGEADFSGAAFGRASFEEAIFKGNADFAEASFQPPRRVKTFFGGAEFYGNTNFRASFQGEVDFEGAVFHSKTDFGAEFHKKANFKVVEFQGPVDFSRVKFMSNVDFSGAQFRDGATFIGVTFPRGVSFLGAIFYRKAQFSRTHFGGPSPSQATFLNVIFQGEAEFSHANFLSQSEFSNAIFQGAAKFGEVTFQKPTEFREAEFQGEADFSKAEFYKSAAFSKAKFHGRAVFSEAKFTGLDLTRATFNKEALFSGTNFGSRYSLYRSVDLHQTSYSILRISWRQLEGHLDSPVRLLRSNLKDVENEARNHNKSVKIFLDEDKTGNKRHKLAAGKLVNWQEVYLRLIKNFGDIGDTESAHEAYYYYRLKKPKFKIERLSTNPGSGVEYIVGYSWWDKTKEWVEYTFFGLTCGYGVAPMRPLAVGGILIVLFTLIYFSKRTSLEYRIKNETFIKVSNKPTLVAFPNHLKNKVRFSANKKHLILTGVMSEQEKDELIELSGDESYHRAIDTLFNKSNKYKETDFFEMQWYRRLYNCFYFSVTNFTTVGIGDVKPIGGFKIATIIEGVLGWLTMALFLVTLANVWLR